MQVHGSLQGIAISVLTRAYPLPISLDEARSRSRPKLLGLVIKTLLKSSVSNPDFQPTPCQISRFAVQPTQNKQTVTVKICVQYKLVC